MMQEMEEINSLHMQHSYNRIYKKQNENRGTASLLKFQNTYTKHLVYTHKPKDIY